MDWEKTRSTAQRLAEAMDQVMQGAEAERQRLQAILDTMPAAVMGIDTRECVTLRNRAMKALRVAPTVTQPYIQKALSGQEVIGEQVTCEHEGEEQSLLVSAVPVRGAGERISGALLCFQDVTEIRRIERLKDEFLSIASHELSAPLSTAKILLCVLERELRQMAKDPNQRLSLDTISPRLQSLEGQLDRIARMVDELLDAARVEHGRMPLHLAVCQVERLVAEAIDQMGHLAGRRPIALCTPAAPLPARLDPHLIWQVLANLLGNAAAHSEGPAPIEVAIESIDEPGGTRAMVTVRDHGQGIAPEDIPHIFNRYYRGRRARRGSSGRAAGLGLGLYICSQIIELHGGRMFAQRAEGGGSRIGFTLPLLLPGEG